MNTIRAYAALWFAGFCLMQIGSLLVILVFAIPFNWIWDAVPAVIFKWPEIGYWDAVGLLYLAALTRSAAKGVKLTLKCKTGLNSW